MANKNKIVKNISDLFSLLKKDPNPKVYDDKKIWKEKAGEDPPAGNDKIIVANNGNINSSDIKIIEDFFSSMWQFKKIKWLK